MRALVLSSLLCAAASMELTKETWDAAVAGKSVFINFCAPWAGYCKQMKPAWGKLTAVFQDSKTVLIADVDCTAAGNKKLCEEAGVKGYPDIKYGDPNNLKKYEGGKDFDALNNFANQNLGLSCGLANVDLCDADTKQMIEQFQGMSSSELDAAIKEKTAAFEKQEADFKALLGLMKAVQARAKSASKSTL